ncbi:hypothetical protein BU26DRAFT_596668 [Trematosphaeria pertusa]|uniref:RNase H type-1 domain-containing protein n=1 Tax=Trematosphaeria pertusa TaxID=390896 RepID=A0A6A6I9G0_9PLEO|nr:uncharacterized protein BU26DRAFT_596668 [Trematosphaeria pertusa]KAF2247011.1 hypothetical protein BU26DRAFT_596668 [Trematosphaeria pertusa]
MARQKPPPEVRYDKRLSAATNNELRYLHKERRLRINRIYDSITHNRGFAATALPYTDGTDDIFQFVPHGYVTGNGETKIFYSDGSFHHDIEKDGLLAAAVAWKERDWQGNEYWEEETTDIERNTGTILDAELEAVLMALEIALQRANEPNNDIRNVIIFTDCQDMVRMLAGEKTALALGPVPLDGKWALEDIYSHSATLKGNGINVVIAWIKGHKAGCEGNRKADRAANRRIVAQSKEEYRDLIENEMFLKRNWNDVKEEYLFRKSGTWFRHGIGKCYVNPTLSGHAAEPVRDEERQTAPPVQHLWGQTKPLEKKRIDYGKLYAKGTGE